MTNNEPKKTFGPEEYAKVDELFGGESAIERRLTLESLVTKAEESELHNEFAKVAEEMKKELEAKQNAESAGAADSANGTDVVNSTDQQ